MKDNYQELIEEVCKQNNITFEYKFRNNCGRAFIDKRHIQLPIPRHSKVWLQYCFHEIAHVLNGNISPRYYEEYLADRKSFQLMKIYGIKIPRKLIIDSKKYINKRVIKAEKRKLKTLKPEVLKYIKKIR